MRHSYSKIKEILEQNPVEDKLIYNPDLRKYERLSVIEKRWKEEDHERTKRALRQTRRCYW